MEIFANHCHLLPPDSEVVAGKETLIKHLDALGIERAVVFAPYSWRMGGNMVRANEWVLEEVYDEPRLIPFATVNPIHPEAIRVLHMMHSESVYGYKIHPSVDIYDLLDPRAMSFYSEAANLDVLLDFHTGIHNSPLELANPIKFDTILWTFPKLKINLEHIGGRFYYETILAIAQNHSNTSRVFLGATSILEKEKNKTFYLGIEKTINAIEKAGAHRIIYGLDFPWHSLEENRSALEKIMSLEISKVEKQKILGVNLHNLLN
jgi:predicted TIM-barrel fold metal-dependent hydrolase